MSICLLLHNADSMRTFFFSSLCLRPPPLLPQTRQLVSVCDSKLLSSAILALAAARPEFIHPGTPSPSSSSLSPSSRSPSRSPSRRPASPSRPAVSPSRHAAPPEGSEGSKNKRDSADLHEDEWVRESVSASFNVCASCAVVVFILMCNVCLCAGEGLVEC